MFTSNKCRIRYFLMMMCVVPLCVVMLSGADVTEAFAAEIDQEVVAAEIAWDEGVTKMSVSEKCEKVSEERVRRRGIFLENDGEEDASRKNVSESGNPVLIISDEEIGEKEEMIRIYGSREQNEDAYNRGEYFDEAEGNGESDSGDSSEEESPKTGDASQAAGYLVESAGALAALAGVIKTRKAK